MDFIPAFMGDKVMETETIYVPAGNGKASVALRSESAEATANILAASGHENKAYDFTNVEAYSYDDVAKYLSAITGKEIKYVSPTVEEYTQTVTNAGIPVEVVGIFASFATAQAKGELDLVRNDFEKLLGRKPTSLNDFLKNVYKS